MNKRRIVKLLAFGLLMSGCATNPSETTSVPLTKFSDISLDAGFDTFISLQEYDKDRETFDARWQSVQEQFLHYNELFDIYNDYPGINNIKTINDNAGIQPVEVEEPIIDMLKTAKNFYDYSGGEFDITMGAVLKVWHNYREQGITANENGNYGELPTTEELEEAGMHIGWEHIVIDEENSTVYIDDPAVSLDVGGIAKGYATEMVARSLEADQPVGAALNAGGNNRTLGDKADGSAWRVRIQNPSGEEKLLIVSESGKFSFVTSGDYERYYIASDGNRYHHIIDPKTLFPADHYRSVTIITEDSAAADCLSTTLFTLSVEEGKKVLEAYKQANEGTFCEAVWIMDPEKAQSDEGKEVGGFRIVWTEGLTDALTFEIN